MQFLSRKYKQLRIVLDPKAHREVEGRRMMVGLMGQFPIGKVVEFQNGKYETNDQRVIEAMKAHESFGYDFYSLEVDEKGRPKAAKPSDKAIREHNEKKALANQVADTDPKADDQD